VGQGHLPPLARGESLELWDVRLSKNITSRSRAGYFFKVVAFAVVAGIRGAGAIRKHPEIQVIHCHHASIVLVVRLLAPPRPVILTVHDLPFRKGDRAASTFERVVRIL